MESKRQLTGWCLLLVSDVRRAITDGGTDQSATLECSWPDIENAIRQRDIG